MNSAQLKNRHSRGVVLIVVLWIIVVSLVMITILAANVRLSVGTILHQHDAVQKRARLMAALNLAKMQILIDKSNIQKKRTIENDAAANPATHNKPLSYQYETGMRVKIVDLSTLINISNISRQKFKLILQKRLNQTLDQQSDSYIMASGSDQIEELLDAWQDWIDADAIIRPNGAEKDYYQDKTPAYLPRNARLETVEELKLIKGFDELFKGVDLSSIFTIYGKSSAINPNIASRETLLFIPGMDESLADNIIKQRKIKAFTRISEFQQFFTMDEFKKIRSWFSLSQSQFYAIIIYPQALEQSQSPNAEIYAYKELVKYQGINKIPQTLMVYPMSKVQLSGQ